jgi:hypothetical protein
MNDHNDRHHDGPHDDPAFRAIEERLGESAARYASERPGLADRIFAASAPRLAPPAPLAMPSARRWALAAAAAVAACASVAVLLVGQGSGGSRQAPGIVAARSIDLAPMGGSEALLVALIDDDSAIHAADGDGIDAGALALTRGASADDVTIELEELLAAGSRR